MSASENQADEASNDTNNKKTCKHGLIIRIRLPPRKRLSDGIQIVSTGVPEDTKNLSAKNVPEQSDRSTQSTTFTATEVKVEEASSNPPGISGDTKNLSTKEVPEQTDNTTQSMIFMTTQVKVEEASSNTLEEGLCNEANRNGLRETVSRDTLHEKANFISLSKNLTTTTGVKGKEESSYRRKGLCEEENLNILNKGLLPENSNRRKGLCEEENINILNKGLLPENSSKKPIKESCVRATDKTPRKSLAISGVQGEVEKKNSGMRPFEDASNDILSNRLLYETNSNTSGKGLPEEATINCSSKNLTSSAVKCEGSNDNSMGNSLSGEARNKIATEKPSADARTNVSRKRPAVPANDKTCMKKLHISVVHAADNCKNTSGMKLFPSVVQAVEQSTSAANLEAIKDYKEFEEKVRRTVYLDNLSHLATEAVIKMALDQFGSVRNVNFLINYTVPFDIPQSALVEMETEKDAESVVNMLHEFPFMMSGMPRPVRGKHATADMFNDRPQRPGSKLEFRWVSPKDPDYENVRKFKLMSKSQEVENLALIKHELEGEKLLAKQQQDSLNCSYRKLEAADTVVLTGWLNRLSHIYGINFDEVF